MPQPPTRTPHLPAVAAAVLAVALTLTGCGGPTASQSSGVPNQAPAVTAFTATEASGGAAFKWTASDPDGDSLTCSLDTNSDGVPDATIRDCQTNASRTVSYADPGAYTATLTVDDNHKHTATATSGVLAAGTSLTPPNWIVPPAVSTGSTALNRVYSVAVDSNDDVVAAGVTSGSAFGPFQGGTYDAVVFKLDATGKLVWGHQLGTAVDDVASAVALDANDDVLVTGHRADGTNPWDTFVARYDAGGALLWDRQLGASGSNSASGIAVDSQHAILIAGSTDGAIGGANQGGVDPFVMKLSATGSQILWARQPGTSANEAADAIAVDANDDVVIAGGASIDYDTVNAFTAKYDANGNRLWLRSIGDGHDTTAEAVAVGPNGDIVIAGQTTGAVTGTNQGGFDAFLAKYDADGNLLWARQFGGARSDRLYGVAVDSAGYVVVTGYRIGYIADGQLGWIAMTAKYDPDGNRIWLREIRLNPSNSEGFGVALDSHGNAYVAGAFTRMANSAYLDLMVASYPP